MKSRNEMLQNIITEDISPSIKSVHYSKPETFVDMFRPNLQSPERAAILVYQFGTPIWRLENSLNI